MKWFRKLIAGWIPCRPQPQPMEPSCRPVLEVLERREVPSTTSPTFQLQSNGQLIQTTNGKSVVVDQNVTSFGVVQNSTGQVTLLDLHQNGQVMERDPSGNWTTLNTFVKTLNVFSDSSGNAQIEMLGQNGSLVQVTLPSGAWKTIAMIGVTWMQGVANNQGDLAKLYWLNTIGQLWQMTAAGQQTLVSSSVKSVTLDSQGNPQIVFITSTPDPIQTYWTQLGQPAWLGTPTGGEKQTPNGQGYYQLFSTGGAIYWTPQTGAHVIPNEIYQRWVALGGESTLGDPITDPQAAADGSGNGGNLFQQFQKAAIYAPAGSTPVALSGSAYTNLLSVTNKVTDAGVRQMTLTLVVANGKLDRPAMLKILHAVETGGITAPEFSSLQQIISSAAALNMPDAVRVLASDVVNGNPANSTYQGATLGNLHAGSSPTQLDHLIAKWFYGTDHPASSGTTYQVVAGTLFGPQNQPQYQQIMQGIVNDCYLLAALGALALRQPQTIRQIITDNHDALTAGNDTYTVRFWNTNSNSWDYMTVDSMLPVNSQGQLVYAGLGLNASSSTNALWVPLIEKAYAQETQEGWLGRPASNSYQALSIGIASQALNQLTGISASQSNLTTEAAIGAVWAKGAMIILDTKSSVSNPSVISNHSYVVTAYNATTGVFTLFSPWGINGGTSGGPFKPGVLNLKWSQITQDFKTWDWATP